MKRKLEINGQEIEIELISKSSDKVKFLFDGQEYVFELKSDSAGEILLVDQHNKNYKLYAKDGLIDSSKGQFKIKKVQRTIQSNDKAANSSLIAPLPGKVVKVLLKVGDEVKDGQEILHIEAMKMEHRICAEMNGVLKSIKVKVGDSVTDGQVLGEID